MFVCVEGPKIFSRTSRTIYGVMGMAQLVTGPHILVITGRRAVGSILGRSIWQVMEVEVLPCATQAHVKQFSESQLDDDERYVALLEHFIAVTGIYYSAEYDLTRSYQLQHGQLGVELGRVESRFFLNRSLAQPLLQAHAQQPSSLAQHFLAVCIEGFVELQPVSIHGRPVTFGLVSRRATGRVGTRHFSRGIDDNGNVSNFVETEQLAFTGAGLIGSFVQVRGSIPLFWRQNTNLRYKPPLELYNEAENGKVFRSHFSDLAGRFGRVLAVNLVDRGGWEGLLAKRFAQLVDEAQDPRLHYVHFDFHQHCRKMQWHKISLLLDSVDADLRAQGHFTAGPSGTLAQQSGVVRTNCIDCLDRTNVVQSAIAQRMLNEQLRELGVFTLPAETVAQHPDLMAHFKTLWADNGDAISQQYAGTGALKSDYTRTGQRTTWGLLQDGIKSLIRYHKSNFTDGYRQDAMDLFHGRYMVSAAQGRSPFRSADALVDGLTSPTALLSFGLFLCYATALVLGRTGLGRMVPRVLHVPLVLAPAALFFWAVLRNGTLIVRYPRLVPPVVGIRARPVQQPPLDSGRFRRKVHQI